MIFYRIAFWLPAAAAGVSLAFAWNLEILSRPFTSLSVFVLALIMQIMCPLFSPVWVLGLVSQAALAIYLLLKIKLEA